MTPDTTWILIGIVASLGAGTLVGVFKTVKGGFGPYNLRAVGIVFIATLATLLAIKDPAAMSAAMGLLGAVAGYLFGLKPAAKGKPTGDSGATV